MRIIIISICFFCVFYTNIFAQSSVSDSLKKFYQSSAASYQEWLQATRLSTFFNYDSIYLKGDTINLVLVCTDTIKSCANLSYFWTELKNARPKIQDDMIKEWAFLADIDLNATPCNILIRDKRNDCYLNIFYKYNSTGLKKSGNFSMPLSNTKVIELANIHPSLTGQKDGIISKESLTKIRQIVKDSLNSYYVRLSKERLWGLIKIKPDLAQISNHYNELTIEVSSIINEVLIDEDFYEIIQIELSFKTSERDKIEVECKIRGKYAAGLYQPKRSSFKPMEDKFPDRIERYEKILLNKVINYITK